jgi:hypothetical protein
MNSVGRSRNPPKSRPWCGWDGGRAKIRPGGTAISRKLRPEYPGHVWSYDFVEGRAHDGRKFRILSIIDEAGRECLTAKERLTILAATEAVAASLVRSIEAGNATPLNTPALPLARRN